MRGPTATPAPADRTYGSLPDPPAQGAATGSPSRWGRLRISRFNIATRLILMTAVMGSFFAATILFSLEGMRRTRASLEQVTNRIERLAWSAQAIRDGVTQDENAVLNLILAQDVVQQALAKVRLMSLRAQVAGSIDFMLLNDPDPRTQELTLKVREAIGKQYQNQDRLIQIVSDRGLADSIAFYQNVVRPGFQELVSHCDLFVALQESEREEHYGMAAQVFSRSRIIFLAVSSLLLVVSVWLCFTIARSITRPIDKAVAIADRLAENHFDVPIDTNEAGEPGRLLSAMRQMAERLRQVKELEQQLIQSQKLETVGQLAGGVAHDFNNLLTAVFGHSELALAGMAEGRPERAHIEEILKAAQRASALTRQLLAFSRRQVLNPEVIDPGRLIADLRRMMERLIPENIELRLLCRPATGCIRVDQTQLEQVILNLVVNARDAMPEGGRLVIETDRVAVEAQSAPMHGVMAAGSYVVLAVSDTGRGMPPEVKEKIFEPFFTTKELGRGTGLGLSTVYGIVKQSGGFIWVYSEPGLGTTFKVYLPLVEAPAVEKPSPRKAPKPAAGKETILLVEDDGEVRRIVATLLREQGYRLIVAGCGEEAVVRAASADAPIDLLLTDVVMPGMNGNTLAERVRESSPGTAVLLMSGYSRQLLEGPGSERSRFACLQKPFTAETLLAGVRRALDSA